MLRWQQRLFLRYYNYRLRMFLRLTEGKLQYVANRTFTSSLLVEAVMLIPGAD